MPDENVTEESINQRMKEAEEEFRENQNNVSKETEEAQSEAERLEAQFGPVSTDPIEAFNQARREIERNNEELAKKSEQEAKEIAKRNEESRQTGDHFKRLKAAGMEHFRQDNELDEDYSALPESVHNTHENEHNDGSKRYADLREDQETEPLVYDTITPPAPSPR